MKRAPERTCLGCRQRRPKGELVRLVRRPDGRVIADAKGPGRGAYVCAARDCVERAVKAGRLGHAFRAMCRLDPGLDVEVLASVGGQGAVSGTPVPTGR